MSRAKPHTLRGHPLDADLVALIEEMLDELYDDLSSVGTSGHNLLSDEHTDTVEVDPVRGDIITAQVIGSSTDVAWQSLAIGSSTFYLKSDGTDAAWAQIQETDIADGTIFARVASAETITGVWTHSANIILGNGFYLRGTSEAASSIRIISHDAGGFAVNIGDPVAANNNTIRLYTTAVARWTMTAVGITTTLQHIGPIGSASAPTYTASGGSNTGVYFPTTTSIGFTTGGTLRVTLNNTQVLSTTPWNGPNGSVGTPALAPSSDTNTGIYFDGSDALLLTTAGTLRTTWQSGGGLKHDYATLFTGVISPSALAAGDTNDYAPTNFANAFVLRLSGDAGGTSALTGIAAPAAGRYIVCYNVSANNITFKHDTTSTATNRFYTNTAADVTVGQHGVIRFWYDTSDTRWRQI